MKKGAPTSAVRIETGTSPAVIVRAAVSTKSMKSAPAKADAGNPRRLSAPAAIRTACGTNKPTQPMRPHMETTEAVNIVAPRITAARSVPVRYLTRC